MAGEAGGSKWSAEQLADLPEHVARNRASWDLWADEFVPNGERSWALAPGHEKWGTFNVPEASLHLLPDDLDGLDAIELGCGTAYVSAWLARRGARPVGIDNSPRQLETARRLQREHGLEFPLLLGNAERVPYPDASFDYAISEYGAALWADPYAWIPEAARLLRPGGRLMFLTNHVLAYLAMHDLDTEGPADERLRRPMFGMGRTVWPDDPDAVEFHLAHGDLIRLLRANGFEVEDLVEIQAPEDAASTVPWMSVEWARQWPSEEAWRASKRIVAAVTGHCEESRPRVGTGSPEQNGSALGSDHAVAVRRDRVIRTGDHHVPTVTAGDRIRRPIAVRNDDVRARATRQGVRAGVTEQRVGAATAADRVGSKPAGERVGAATAADRVVTGVAGDLVPAPIAEQRITAGPAVDRVVTATAMDGVGLGRPIEIVGAGRAIDGRGERRRRQREGRGERCADDGSLGERASRGQVHHALPLCWNDSAGSEPTHRAGYAALDSAGLGLATA